MLAQVPLAVAVRELVEYHLNVSVPLYDHVTD